MGRHTDHRTRGLTAERRAELARIMARAAHDRSAAWSLLERFGPEIRAALAAAARRSGLPPVPAEELDSLVVDACDVLVDVAGSWSPEGGALPWNYARPRLANLLHRHAGPRLAPLPEREQADERNWSEAAPADELPAVAVLERLAGERADPVVTALRDALAVAVPADAELVLRYVLQQAQGDPSPSHTVATTQGRSPDAVRQAYCRARRKLRALALAEHRYRCLLGLPFLTEGRPAVPGVSTERAA